MHTQVTPPASSLPGPVRGPTETNSLAKWALAERRDVRRDYLDLLAAGVISDHCRWIFDVAEADCPRAIVALKYSWLVDVLEG